MDEMYSIDQLSEACRLLRLDPNYLPGNCNIFNDNDDDPLGRPEITVKINDDWTVSSDKKKFDTNKYEPGEETDENEDEDEDENEVETEVYTLDGKVIDTFNSDMVSRSQRDASSDEDEQIVPSSPKVRKLSPGEDQLKFPIKSVIVAEAVRKYEKDMAEARGSRKDDEKQENSDKETRKRSDVQREIGDRSKPQPP